MEQDAPTTKKIVGLAPTGREQLVFVYCDDGSVYLHDPLAGRYQKLADFPGSAVESTRDKQVEPRNADLYTKANTPKPLPVQITHEPVTVRLVDERGQPTAESPEPK